MPSIPIDTIPADSIQLDSALVDSLSHKCQCCIETLNACTQTTWIDIFSVIGSAVTIVCFFITIWQVWGIRGRLNNVESKIKEAILKERERAANIEQKSVIQSILDKISDVNSHISNDDYKAAYASMACIKSYLSKYKASGHQLDGLDEAEAPITANMSSIKEVNINPIKQLFSKPDFTFIIDDMTKLNTLLTTELNRLNNE